MLELPPAQLTLVERLKTLTPPLGAAGLGCAVDVVNNHIHNLRGMIVDNVDWDPMQHSNNAVWGLAIGTAIFMGGSDLLERARPRLAHSTAGLAVIASCALGAGWTVNAGWETRAGTRITSHIPRDIPLVKRFNTSNRTTDTVDLTVGTLASGAAAVSMALQQQFYLRRKQEFEEVIS